MKKRINFILVLIISSTIGLISLQVYWNYTAYEQSVKTFRSDINEALKQAVEKEEDQRNRLLVKQYQKWLADTSQITITAKWDKDYQKTVIYFADRHPAPRGRRVYNLSFSNIQRKTDSITPEMKSAFIQTFTTNEIYRDLQTGSVFYYTQHLGDSLTVALRQKKVNVQNIVSLYRKALAGYDIDNAFLLDTGLNRSDVQGFPYRTRIYRSSPPYPAVSVSASFSNPNLIILNRMKTVLISSLVLIAIIIFCFSFSVKTLLSQKKLADLKADFMNNMTHELKTPVATISIAAEAIQDFKLSKTSSDEYLSIIRQQAGNLTSLIDQILKSMVNERTTIELNPEPVSLAGILNNCIRQYQPQLRQHNMETSLISEGASVWVNGDLVHLGNVMANLLDNAIKYGSADSVIEINIKADEKNAIVYIINNGKGIPTEYKDKVFDRFFRVPTGNIHNVKGYGLGLSYVQDIIRQHGGTVSISSTAYKTTFTLQLPIIQHDISESIIA